MDYSERIEELEEKLRETPVNKSTEKERARLKSRISELEEEQRKAQKGTGEASGYGVKHRGDATVALVGFPSVGKSTLLNKLTNQDAETGEYEFTTLEVNPGTLKWEGLRIQILDVPGLIGGAARGKGDGSKVISVIRSADLLVGVYDPEEFRKDQLMREIEKAGIRPNQTPPNAKLEKKGKGGIKIKSTVKQDLDQEEIKEILRKNGYRNARLVLREEVNWDDVMDIVHSNRRYLPMVNVLNKSDTVDRLDSDVAEEIDLRVSAEKEYNLQKLKKKIWDSLDMIRVNLDDKKGDERPLVLPEGATVSDLVQEIGGDFPRRFKFAEVSGSSAKFPEQRVGEEHVLEDGDTVYLQLKPA